MSPSSNARLPSLSLPGGRVEIAAGGDRPAVEGDQHRLRIARCSPRRVRRGANVPAGPSRWPPTNAIRSPLAIDDQPHGHALHPSGREPRANLPPQQGRNLVAVQPVDDPPRFLGPHQVVVDLPRMGQRLADRLFGDFMKHQPMHRHLRLQHLAEMPTDGLSLAVFVRRQIQVAGVLEQVLELPNLLGLVGRNNVHRLEVLVDVHPQVGPVFSFVLLGDFLGPLGQVANVADAGLDRRSRCPGSC